MRIIKTGFAVLVAAAAFCAFGQEKISLADARAQIGDCIKTPAKMTETMKKLSAEDQTAFLAEVNAAIESMPGSTEAQAATYLNVNRAAYKGAEKDNLPALVAETYATVPPEILAVLNERLAVDVFNRAADPSVTYTDEQYVQVASNLMVKVNERMKGVDNGAARSTFARLMLVRASNGSPASLADTLVSTLPSESQEVARNDWIPAAMAEGESKSYEPLLEGAEATSQTPSVDVVLAVAGPQMPEAMLGSVADPALNIGQSANAPIKSTQPESMVNNPEVPNPEEPKGYPNQY